MSDTITLTREQYDAILAQADLAVSYADDLSNLLTAFEVLGLTRAVETISLVQDEINECRNEITRTLLRADDAQPALKASGLKIRLFGKWLWPFNKSNKEA